MPSSAVRTFTDPDAYQAAISGAHVEGVITGRSKFRAESTTIGLHRLSLQRCEESLPRTVYSAVDPNMFGRLCQDNRWLGSATMGRLRRCLKSPTAATAFRL